MAREKSKMAELGDAPPGSAKVEAPETPIDGSVVTSSQSQPESFQSLQSFDSSDLSKCPHCHHSYKIAFLADHVASCDFVNSLTSHDHENASEESDLSPPPVSPARLARSAGATSHSNGATGATLQFSNGALDGNSSEVDDAEIRAWVNPDTEFDYYDEIEGNKEEKDVDPDDPNLSQKFKYRKLQPASFFEKYLEDPNDMEYDVLYHRLETVSGVLEEYQEEFDQIEKEINIHETSERVKDEKNKALAQEIEEKRRREEAEDKMKAVEKKLADLKKERSENPIKGADPEMVQCLQEFTEAEKALENTQKKPKKEKPGLIDVPYPELKLTKDDIEDQKRRRGRLMDSTKFDDIKQADAYGFEYSSHPKHLGNQPLVRTDLTDEPATTSRSQRVTTRKKYNESEEDDGNGSEQLGKGKRTKKPRHFDDGNESAGLSRGGTPLSMDNMLLGTPSGGRSGTARSRLHQSTTAPVTPPQHNLNQDSPSFGSIAKLPKKKGRPSNAELAARKALQAQITASQEDELVESATDLVNEVETDKHADRPAPVGRAKYAGGRARNAVASAEAPLEAAHTPQPKRRGRGSRFAQATVESPVNFQEEHDDTGRQNASNSSGSLMKQEATAKDHSMQFGDVNGVMQSTEQDDRSRMNSETTMRPTSSSSNATTASHASAEPSRRSNRSSTREKSDARKRQEDLMVQQKEMKMKAKTGNITRDSSVAKKAKIETAHVENNASATPGRSMRNRTADETIGSSSSAEAVIVAEAPLPPPKTATTGRGGKRKRIPDETISAAGASNISKEVASTPETKKRKNRAPEVNSPATEPVPLLEAPIDIEAAGRGKRKHTATVTESSVEPDALSDSTIDGNGPAAKKIKIKSVKSEPLSQEELDAIMNADVMSIDGRPLGDIEDDTEREAARARRTQDLIPLNEIEDRVQRKAAKKRRRARAKSVDGRPLFMIEDPYERERALKERIKGFKISKKTTKRWAEGKMAGAQQTKLKNKEAIKARAAGAIVQNAQGDRTKKKRLAGRKATKKEVEELGIPTAADLEEEVNEIEERPKKKARGTKKVVHGPAEYAGDMVSTAIDNGTITATARLGSNSDALTITAMGTSQIKFEPASDPIGLALAASTSSAPSSSKRPYNKKAAATPTSASAPKTTKTKGAPRAKKEPPPPVVPARSSTRPRRPTDRARGYDGAADDDDEDNATPAHSHSHSHSFKHQFASEYDHFQALTTPRSPVTLGKRKRTQVMDLSEIIGQDTEEEEEEEFESDDDNSEEDEETPESEDSDDDY